MILEVNINNSIAKWMLSAPEIQAFPLPAASF